MVPCSCDIKKCGCELEAKEPNRSDDANNSPNLNKKKKLAPKSNGNYRIYNFRFRLVVH